MSEQQARLDKAIAAIESAFGGRWGAWLSDTGWWWAARSGVLTAAERAAGAVPFLQADDPDELAERIRQQEALTRPEPDADPEPRRR
jgi:hypothetical protein